MSNQIAVYRNEDNRYFISWSGGTPIIVGGTRQEAVAALQSGSEFDEPAIQDLLDNADSSASTFLATALAGTTAEVSAIADAVEALPTSNVTAELSSKIEKVIDSVAALSSTVVRQQQLIDLAELEKLKESTIARMVSALEGQRIPADEAKAHASRAFRRSADGQRLKALREAGVAEWANG
jgi:hypothetical protein